MFDIVLRTSDYSVFNIMTGNRDVPEIRVRKIKDSIQKNGYIFNPIICNEKMEVVDGQGRLEALKRLGLPVEYIVHPGLTVSDCIVMNAYQTKWTIPDYVDSFAKIGNRNYVYLQNLLEEFSDLPIRVCASACVDTIGLDPKFIQNGSFVCTEEKYKIARKALKYAQKFSVAMKKINRGNNTYMYTAIMFVYQHVSGVDYEKLQENFEKYYATDIAQNFVNTPDAIKCLNNIYNYRARDRVYFESEYDQYCRKLNTSYATRWSKKK